MALVSSNPEADPQGIHLVHWKDIVTKEKSSVVLAPGRLAVTYLWLQEAFKRFPVDISETVFDWATRMERTKVITFSQAYLLRSEYASHRFVYLKDATHIN